MMTERDYSDDLLIAAFADEQIEDDALVMNTLLPASQEPIDGSPIAEVVK